MITAIMQPVSSSHLTAIGYDDETESVFAEFKNGTTYEYFDVPPRVWQRFNQSKSKGKFLWANLRTNYNYARA